jgi:hypothetical protein
MLCFDQESYQALAALDLPHVSLIPHAELESAYPALATVKAQRAPVEYYWTCTPFLPLYLFRQHPGLDVITYLDADLFFFSDPSLALAELGEQSILIVQLRYPAEQAHDMVADYGLYNVSLNSFRNDAHGIACLEWWSERCLEWCYNRSEAGKFGDQKYLDDWPQRFRQVVVAQHPGVGLAPWNVHQFALTQRHGQVFVDGQPMVCYHFSGFRYLAHGLYDTGPNAGGIKITPVAKRLVYEPYARAVVEATHRVRRVWPGFKAARSISHRELAWRILQARLGLVGAEAWFPAVCTALLAIFVTGCWLYNKAVPFSMRPSARRLRNNRKIQLSSSRR